MSVKLLIGGSPCTYWSIAQKNNREVAAEGMGWGLFKNYLIAKERFEPDFFLYENNKSASQAIKDQIAHELGVGSDPMARFTYINSALVSAQNRQRFYVTNFGDIEQPADRGVYLRDILESGFPAKEKSYVLKAQYRQGMPADDMLKRHQNEQVFEPIFVGEVPGHNGKYHNGKQASQQYRVFSVEGKSVCCDRDSRKYIAEPVIYQVPHGFNKGGMKYDKAPTLTANGDWAHNNFVVEWWDGKTYPVYEVESETITIKDKSYSIKLQDGFYIIRKLTVVECSRLQTMPDNYRKAVSPTQAYKGLGNGWTAEVIIHLLNHALKNVPKDEEITVLSLYDGIGTGRYCLDKMGFTNVKYHAYEIDKHAMIVASDNYPDILQLGDAFAVREDSWKPPQTRSEWLDELLEVI